MSDDFFFFVSHAENDITEIPSQLRRKMCDQMDKDQDISSVAHHPFPFKSTYFPVHLGSTSDALQSYILFHLSDAL